MVKQDVFVTGMGWSTALGSDLLKVWGQLKSGYSGFQKLPHSGILRNDLAAPVPGLTMPPGPRMHALAVQAIGLAMADAGVKFEGDGLQLVLGTSLGSWLDEPVGPQSKLDAWALDVARATGAKEPPVSISTACSSGSDAIAFAAGLIQAGEARICVCGGADVLTPAKRMGHSALATMSPTRLRAFDERHDGTLLGEGAAFLVLQAMPGPRPYARLVGIGSSNDAAGFTSPAAEARGALSALRHSLMDARLKPSAIGVINAHGSGTPLNDATEAIAFRTLFQGPERPVAFATKGNFGHTLGATGAIEAVATILALVAGEVPPVAGLEFPDPAFPLPLPLGQPFHGTMRFGASLTLGFGGFNTCLIFERYP